MRSIRSGLLVSLAAVLVTGLGSSARAQGAVPAAGQPMPTVQPPATTRSTLPGPPAIRAGSPVSVLLFDFQNAAMDREAGAHALAAAQITLKAGLIYSGRYNLVTFSPLLAMVKRAVSDQILTPGDLDGLTDPATGEINIVRCRRIAELLRIQTVMTGTVEAASVNRGANSATATITVQLLSSVTGKAVKSPAGVTGAATGTAETSDGELAAMAGRDAALKALAELGISPEAAAGPPAGAGEEGGGGGEDRGFFGNLWHEMMKAWRPLALAGSFGALTAILAWR